MPLDGLYTATYGIPKLKIHNASIATNLFEKESEKVVALADLSGSVLWENFSDIESFWSK